MARMTRRQLQQFAKRMEPRTRKAFLDAVAEVKDGAQLDAVASMVQEGNVDGVMFVLGLNPARFSGVAEVMRQAYLEAGNAAALEVPELRMWQPYSHWQPSQGVAVGWRFDITNDFAAAWVQQRSSEAITNIIHSQREAIRGVLEDGILLGDGPRTTALNIIGRIEGGRRAGGVIGLSRAQERAVSAARRELMHPGSARAYLGRIRRDRRFDATVLNSIQTGKPLTRAQIDRIIGRYEDRLLFLRGEVIARTETITSMNAAREESYRQAIESGGLLAENVICTWESGGDDRVRDSHQDLHGQERKFGEPFESVSREGGVSRMMFPGDTSLGAPPEEIINCRCMKVFRIDHIAEARRAA